MNEASQWRLDIAKSMTRVFSQNPKVKAVILGGSVARGIADPYSDTDTGAYCTELPTEEELKAAAAQTTGEKWIYNYNFEGKIGIECRFGAARVEFSHSLIGRIENIIADVVDRHETDTVKHKAAGGVLEAVPLYGEDLFEQWRGRSTCPRRI